MSGIGSGHERWEDATGAYVLGALADDERAGFEAHLAGCPECRGEVEELRVAADALPTSVPPLSAPPALQGRIMAEVRREAALLAAAGAGADRPPAPEPRRRRFALRLPLAAGLVTAALLLGLVAGRVLWGSGDGVRTVAAAVDRAQAPGARARVEVQGGRGVLVASGLPSPPAGRVYQVWLVRGAEKRPRPTPLLFTPRSDGTATAGVPGSMAGVRQVLVSTEPQGGSPQPTSAPILAASMS